MILPGERIPNLTVISETKVNFGKEKSHDYYREIIKSVFALSRKRANVTYISLASTSSMTVPQSTFTSRMVPLRAQARVLLGSLWLGWVPPTILKHKFSDCDLQKSYENNDIIDDDYNTKWFYQAPVGGTPEAFHLKHRVGGINAWDATLDAYLKTQRVAEGPTIGHVRVGRDGRCQREEGSKE